MVTRVAESTPYLLRTVSNTERSVSPYLHDLGPLARLGEIFIVAIDTSVITSDVITKECVSKSTR
jgi:hypothetical protein